jgi:hypothetical protein
MALVGYEIEKQRVQEKIQELRAKLKGKAVSAPAAAGPKAAAPKASATKRDLSPAARRRISAAQKKRWAAHRKQAKQAAKQA